MPRREPVTIYGQTEELDLREEFLELMEEAPQDELDLREEFDEWFFDYNPNKKR